MIDLYEELGGNKSLPSAKPTDAGVDLYAELGGSPTGEDSWSDVGGKVIERSGHLLNAQLGGIEQAAAVAENAPGEFAANTIKGINRLAATGLAYVAPGSAARGRVAGGDPLIRAAGNITPLTFAPESVERIKADPTFQRGADRFAYHTEQAKKLQPNVDQWSAKGIASAAGEAGLTSVLPAIAAGIVGGVVAGLTPMTAQVYGQKLGEMVKAGKPLAEAQDAAGFAVLSEVVPEVVPLSYALKAGIPFWKRILGASWRGGFQEQVTELLQIEWDKNKGQDISLKDALNRIAYSGVVGAVPGATMGIIGHGGKAPPQTTQTTQTTPAEIPADVEDVLSGEPGGIGQRALPAPRIIVSPAGEAAMESQTADLYKEDLGQSEVAGAVQGRAPLPAEPEMAPQRALPQPKLVGTPEGGIGTEAQVEAARAAQASRGTDLGTNEVANAVQGRAPLPDVGQGELLPAEREPADLLKTIAAAGGLSREAAQSEGIDPANFKEQKYRTMVFGRPLFPRAGGLTMDGLAEFLSQRGFLPEGQYSANEALALVDRALRGEKIYAQEDAGTSAERAARQHEADQREQFAGRPGETGVEYRAADLRGRMEEVGRNRVKRVLGAEAAQSWQPKPDDFNLSGYSKEAQDVQELTDVMFEGRRVMGSDAFEAYFERFAEQNANLSGDDFEHTLSQAIKEAERAKTEQRPSPARQEQPGAERQPQAVQPGGRQAEAEQAAEAQPEALPAVQEVTPPQPAAAAAPATPAPASERRTDIAGRKRVADMSVEEAHAALLTDPLTGLPNRRAYDEAEKKPVQAAIDLDGLKWINDNMGHESGDMMLTEIGHALRDSGLDAYHISGDEFMAQGDDQAALERGLEAVRMRLDNARITVEGADGKTITKTGVHFSYGIGSTRHEADQALGADKSNREAVGLRNARGEAPRGVERAERQPDRPDTGAAAQEVEPATPTAESPQTDLAGEVNPTKQAVRDKEAARQKKIDEAPPMEAGPGDLFSDASKQADLFAPMVKAAEAMTKAAEALTESVKASKQENPAELPATSPARKSDIQDTQGSQSVVKSDAGSAKLLADGAQRPPGVKQTDGAINVPGDRPKGSAVNPSVTKSGPDSFVTDVKTLGDLPDADTLVEHGYGAIEVPSQSRVFKAVLSFIHDDKVFRSVVSSIPVDVMNNLVGSKFSAKDAFNDKSVLIHALTTNTDLAVRGAAIDAIVSSPAITIAEIPLVDLGGAAKDDLSAPQTVDRNSHEAATSAASSEPMPTEAQIEAGNYRHGHINIAGLDISVENPAGSIRAGKDGNGKPWTIKMQSTYGYFKRSEGKDGDQVDVFVKPGTPEDYSGPVFVIDQTNKDGAFDEHKVMLGFDTAVAAKAGYLENYTKGWTGLGAMRKFSLGEFKGWLENGNTKKAVALGRAEPKPSQTPPIVRKKEPFTFAIKPEGDGFIIESDNGGGVVIDGKPNALFAGGNKNKIFKTRQEAELYAKSKKMVLVDARPEASTAAPVANSSAEHDAHDAFVDRMYKGDVTPDEIKAHFQQLVDNKDRIVEQLSSLKKDGLLNMLGDMAAHRYKNETKAEVVTQVYDSMLNDLNLSRGLTYSMGKGNYEAALKKAVDSITAGDIKEFADKIAKQRDERAATMKNMVKAVKDPKTLDDYFTYMRFHQSNGKTQQEAYMTLTPEQRATFDEMAAEKSRGERATMEDLRKTDLRKTDVRVAATTAEGEIVETKHTKTGIPLFVVKAAERVDREVYNQWNATAKRLGGYYSSFRGAGAVPGFQFKTRENADAFLKFIGGNIEQAQEVAQARRDAFKDDRGQSAVERLNEMADSLEAKADESLGQDRQTNTARRARFAAGAEAAAESNKALAATMRNIAKAIEDGKAKFLNRVRTKAQVEMLRAFVRQAQHTELRAKYPEYLDQEKHKGETPTAETIDHAAFPRYTAYRSDLARLGRELEQIDGTKKLGAAILKVADDVTDTYLKFAKENLHLVSTFGRSDGKPAIFSSRADAEAAIKRSGYKGKAVVLPFKRNQNIIILSPAAAQEKGIWSGDPDKRITINAETGAEIVAKVKAMSGRNRVSMPYIYENVAEERARLKVMGIETPTEFRSALREFVGLRVATKAPDKVKEMERAMIGRRKDGLDFFPTPSDQADEMVQSAGIEEGMSVLEPSAGMGHIADRIREAGHAPDVVELSGDRRELLEAKGYNVVGSDFMDMTLESTPDGKGYDRIIMNPPFSDRRDMQHVQHAYDLLKPGGRLVAIMGEGVFFGQDKKADEFRDWLDDKNGTSEKLEEGAFLDPSLPVNTGVAARMVVIDKTKETDQGTALFQKPAAKMEYPLAPAGSRYEETSLPITYMTPAEFLGKARPLELDDVARDNIDDLKSHIQSGKSLDPLHIYADGKEDGRHRAVAAQELGIKMVPVVVHGEAKKAAASNVIGVMNPETNTEDSGSELTYNKRNRIARLTWDDIKDKDAALRIREAVKSKVYPRPDYQAMVDGGMQPLIAHIVKQAYDALAAKPNTRVAPTDAQLEAYIGSVNHYMDGVMEWANDRDKVSAFIHKLAGKARVLQGASAGTPTSLSSMVEVANRSMLETVYPNGWRNSIDAVRIIGGNKTLAALQPSTNEAVRAMNEINKGWPSAQEAWQRQGYRVVNGDDMKASVYAGTRTDGTKYAAISYKLDGRTINTEYVEGAERESDAAVQDEIKSALDEIKGKYLLLNKNNKSVGAFDSESAAQDKARELTAKGGKKTISDKGISVEAADRVGADRRMEGEDINSDKLRETFGFKGVNFGNWMKGKGNEAERQLHLNHAYDSFMDLAELLGIPPKAMSLNGMLGLAIGAQGTGQYAAHFVPGVNEINLSRTSGAGSLAHEVGHAIDHHFARLAGLERKSDPFLTNNVSLSEKSLSPELRQEMLAGFKAIVKSMNTRTQTEAEINLAREASIQRAEKNVDGWLRSIRSDFIREKVDEKAFDALADKVRNLDLGDGMVMVSSKTALHQTIADLRDLYTAAAKRPYSLDRIVGMQNNVDHLKYLKSDKAQASEHIPQTPTDYSRDAAKLDKDKGGKPYWNTQWEKFARAFDAYISDKLEAKAAKNTYLSHAGRAGETVPKGEERKAINAAFDKLVSELKTKETDQGTALFQDTAAYGKADLADRIAAVLDGKWSNIPLYLGETPKLLQRLGMKPNPVGIEEHVVDKAHFDHGLTKNELTALADAIADPVAVFDSDTVKGTMVVVTDMVKSDGSPIIVAVHPDVMASHITANMVASAYPKTNAKEALLRWTGKRLLRYVNNEKRLAWQESGRGPIPQGAAMQSVHGKIVLTERDVVKDDRQTVWGDSPWTGTPNILRQTEKEYTSDRDYKQAVDDYENSEPVESQAGPAGVAARRDAVRALNDLRPSSALSSVTIEDSTNKTENDSTEKLAGIFSLEGHEKTLQQREREKFSTLRRQGDKGVSHVGREFPEILRRHGKEAGRPNSGAKGQQQGLQPRELPVGDKERSGQEQAQQRLAGVPRTEETDDGVRGRNGYPKRNFAGASEGARNDGRGSVDNANRGTAQRQQDADIQRQDTTIDGLGEGDRNQQRRSVGQNKQEKLDGGKSPNIRDSLLAATLSNDLAFRQRVNLVGHSLTSPADLAALAQVYRDPRFETFRVFFINDAKQVVSQMGLTSRLPATTATMVGTDMDAYLGELWALAKESGATGYYLLHNHPSGFTLPSLPDRTVTAKIASKIPGFAGHVIIDTNQYSVIDGDGKSQTFHKDFPQADIFTRDSEHAGFVIQDAPDLMRLAKKLEADNGSVTLILTDHSLEVTGITTLPAASFKDRTSTRFAMIRALRAAKGSLVFAVGADRGLMETIGRSGAAVDVVHAKEDGGFDSLGEQGFIASSSKNSPFPSRRGARVSPDTSAVFEKMRQNALAERKDANRKRAKPAETDVAQETRPYRAAISGDRFTLPAETQAQRAQRKLQNEANRWDVVQDAVEKQGGTINESTNVSKAIERYPGKVAAGLLKFGNETIEPLMQRIVAADTSMDEVGLLAYAEHAAERNAAIKALNPRFTNDGTAGKSGSGMTDKEAAAIIAQAKAQPNAAELFSITKALRDIADKRLDNLVAGGEMTKDQADAYRTKYKFYVPLKGFEQIDENGIPQGTGKGLSTAGKIDFRALGRSSRAGQVMQNVFRDYEAGIMLTEKATVAKHVAAFIEANPDDALWKIGQPERKPFVMKGQKVHQVVVAGNVVAEFKTVEAARLYGRSLINNGVSAAQVQVHNITEETVVQRPSMFDENAEIRTIKDGKPVRIQITDPGLVRSYNRLWHPGVSDALHLLNDYNGWLRQMYTQKNPAWFFLNVFRDVQSVIPYVAGEHGFGIARAVPGNIPMAFKAAWNFHHKKSAGPVMDGIIKLYLENGGYTGFSMVGDIEAQTLRLQGLIHRYTPWIETVQSFKKGEYRTAAHDAGVKLMNTKMFAWIEAMNSTFENMTRLAVFKAAIDSGLTPKQAASLAKNASTNFNRRGEWGPNMNAAWLFSNAGIQGTRNVGHALFFSPHKKQVWALMAGLVAMGIMAGLMSDDDDDLIDDQVRQRSLTFKIGGVQLSIPMAWGYGFFAGLGQYIAQFIKHPEKRDKVAVMMADLTATHFSPIGNPLAGGEAKIEGLANLAPTPIRPFANAATNTSPFGGPLYPESPYDKTKPDSEKMWRRTKGTAYDKTASWLNEITGGDVAREGMISVSPESLKMGVSTLFGGVGKLVTDTASLLFSEDIKSKNIPVVKNFYREIDADAYMQRFYRDLDDAATAYKTYHAYLKHRDRNDAREYMLEHRAYVTMGKAVEGYSEIMKQYRDKEDAIKASDLSSGEKKLRIDAIDDKRIKLAERFNKNLKRDQR